MLRKTLSQWTRAGWRRATVISLGAVIALVGGTAGAAVALAPGQSDGASISAFSSHSANRSAQFQVRTENAAWTGAGTGWTDVPGAARTFVVPSGQSRMFHAVFSAESLCQGSSATWCSARVVVTNSAGAILAELNPISGTDYAFDAPSSTYEWEGESMSRTSYYYGAGTYVLKVQAARVGATSFRLDDWNFSVASYAFS